MKRYRRMYSIIFSLLFPVLVCACSKTLHRQTSNGLFPASEHPERGQRDDILCLSFHHKRLISLLCHPNYPLVRTAVQLKEKGCCHNHAFFRGFVPVPDNPSIVNVFPISCLVRLSFGDSLSVLNLGIWKYILQTPYIYYTSSRL